MRAEQPVLQHLSIEKFTDLADKAADYQRVSPFFGGIDGQVVGG